MVAVAAAMETPAIVSALVLARRGGLGSDRGDIAREVLLNGAVVMLLGSFLIGAITGQRGFTLMKPFLVDSFAGFLCLFLLDMGLVAGRGLRDGARGLSLPLAGFGILMPLVGASCAVAISPLLGLSTGGTAVLVTLAASASYIAVPAAMRLALPEADPTVPITLSLGVTFPFNLLVGIPVYIAIAHHFIR